MQSSERGRTGEAAASRPPAARVEQPGVGLQAPECSWLSECKPTNQKCHSLKQIKKESVSVQHPPSETHVDVLPRTSRTEEIRDWLQHGWCHIKMLSSWCMFCTYHTTLYQFTVLLEATLYIHLVFWCMLGYSAAFIIHQTLTGTTGSLTYMKLCDLLACEYTWGTISLQSHPKNFC